MTVANFGPVSHSYSWFYLYSLLDQFLC